MLDEPPQVKFNVTQSFALFSTVLLWSKNHAWVGGDRESRPHWFGEADHAAQDARELLRDTRNPPQIVMVDREDEPPIGDRQINSDFVEMSAEDFFKWLRDALAHGDGRTIRPIHRRSTRGNKTLLAGFEIVCPEQRCSGRQLTLVLHHADMRRIGAILADLFCHSLSGDDRYFEQEAGTSLIKEAASAA
jgi:hypothetical protein